MTVQAISNSHNIFSLLDLSRVHMLAHALELNLSDQEHVRYLSQLLVECTQHLSAEVSGVALDHELGFTAIEHLNAATGLLLAFEKKSDFINPTLVPTIMPEWGIEHIRNNYGVVKLELYYHPQEPENVHKKQFVAEVFDYCQYERTSLVLELMVYHPSTQEPDPQVLQETQLQAASEFAPLCDVLALEYLDSPFAAVTLTAQLDTPWLYNAREVGYETFKQNLRACMQSGAQGFLAGDPFWHGKEIAQALAISTLKEAREQCIKHILRDRIIEVTRIATEEGLKNQVALGPSQKT